jgi:alanine dehydrogenase
VWGALGDGAAFVEEMRGAVPLSLREVRSGAEAAQDADVVILATASPVPVVQREWVRPGALVISVGACRRDHREMDPALLAASCLIVDSRDAALIEAGDIVQGIAEGRFGSDHVRGELGDVVLGRVRPRASDGDIVVFKSLGLAVEDVAAADVVYRRAIAEGAGRTLSL